jgi:acetyl esterase/lipase
LRPPRSPPRRPISRRFTASRPGETADRGAEHLRFAVAPAPPQKEITNVTTPTLEFYLPPKDKNTGAAMIVLPGGGFTSLKMDYEGEDAAAWMSSIGVAGIVLKYRVPKQGADRYVAASQDAQRSISLVRSRAAEWGIDPAKIGIFGFSAGSIAGAVVETHYDERMYPAIDEIDKTSCKPDFAALIYPGTVLVDGKLLPDIRYTKESPPTFIAVADADHTEFSIALYQAMKAAGVPSELHIYADGAHGFGMRPGPEPHTSWPLRLEDWMRWRKIIPRAEEPAPTK